MEPKSGTRHRVAAHATHRASIKTEIQSLARQLWVEKRKDMNPAEIEWLVDGRLMRQLDRLSNDELLRVKGLLERSVTPKRYMTGSPV